MTLFPSHFRNSVLGLGAICVGLTVGLSACSVSSDEAATGPEAVATADAVGEPATIVVENAGSSPLPGQIVVYQNVTPATAFLPAVWQVDPIPGPGNESTVNTGGEYFVVVQDSFGNESLPKQIVPGQSWTVIQNADGLSPDLQSSSSDSTITLENSSSSAVTFNIKRGDATVWSIPSVPGQPVSFQPGELAVFYDAGNLRPGDVLNDAVLSAVTPVVIPKDNAQPIIVKSDESGNVQVSLGQFITPLFLAVF